MEKEIKTQYKNPKMEATYDSPSLPTSKTLFLTSHWKVKQIYQKSSIL